jgi:hypothetical protein
MNTNDSKVYGSALGPDWAQNLDIKGCHEERSHNVLVENECEIRRIMTRGDYLKEVSNDAKLKTNDDVDDWPVYVELTNSKVYGCDFIVSATGVRPCVEAFTKNNQVNKRSFYRRLNFDY